MGFFQVFATFLCLFPLCSIIAETRENVLANHHIKEFWLQNGLRVCIKQTPYEEGEFGLQLFAMGGYAALPSQDRPSALLAADVAWESGLNQRNADQLACDLYQHSLEMKVTIQLFDRFIEAYGPSQELGYCLQIIKALLTKPQFDMKAFKQVLTKALASWQDKMASQTTDLLASDAFLMTNLQNWELLNPLTSQQLNQAQFEKTKQIFQNFFADPSHFTLVLVGDLDLDQVIALLEKHLSPLPTKRTPPILNPLPPSFPKGITKKNIKGFSHYHAPLTRLTFPIQVQNVSISSLNFLCHVISQRLTQALAKTAHPATKMEVHYEFPLFPCLDEKWVIIQFSSSLSTVPSLSQLILTVLNESKTRHATPEELASFHAKNEEEFEDIDSLLSLISNSYRGGWDIADLCQTRQPSLSLPKHKTDEKQVDSYMDLNQYSLITLYP